AGARGRLPFRGAIDRRHRAGLLPAHGGLRALPDRHGTLAPYGGLDATYAADAGLSQACSDRGRRVAYPDCPATRQAPRDGRADQRRDLRLDEPAPRRNAHLVPDSAIVRRIPSFFWGHVLSALLLGLTGGAFLNVQAVMMFSGTMAVG